MSELRARNRRALAAGFYPATDNPTPIKGDFRMAVAFKSVFSGLKFDECKMAQGEYRASEFTSCLFFGCDMSSCHFEAAKFTNCQFINCNLDLARFDNAIVEHTSFVGGRAEYASFFEASVASVTFATQLHGADLRFIYSHDLNYDGSNLWGASIRVSCTQFKDVVMSDRAFGLMLGLLSKMEGNDERRAIISGLLTDSEQALLGKLMNEEEYGTD